jgi:hypothetical protein
MTRGLGYLLRLVAVVAVILVAWDAALFRSGLYYRWLEPQSTAGMTRGAIRLVDQNYAPDRRNVLVLGNSQVGEGFSQQLADQATQGSGLHFLNAAIPGTDLRAWYYLLRQIDPHADRFAAVVLQVSYDPGEPIGVQADYPLDIAYLTPLLGLRDVADFPATFDDRALAERARRAILFPAQPLRNDIAAFLAAPRERLKQLRKWRKYFVPSALQYPGRDQALPDLSLDPSTLQPTDWGSDEAKLKPVLSKYFDSLRGRPSATTQVSNERYAHQWLSRIAEPYRAHGIPVILMSVPRGPWHAALPPSRPAGAVADLIAAGMLTALPGDSFVDLERPRYFFDSLHMNRAGRERFSPALAQQVAARLH